MDNQSTKNGKIIVVSRENIGISFGGFNYAFQKFKDDYDY